MAEKSQLIAKRTLQRTSENRIIQLLKDYYPDRSVFVKKGIGDDAAVILPRHAREYWLIATDMLLEDIDFRREWMTPRQLGYKSISVNLSDLAAMGARPRFYVVSLALPRELGEVWILQFYKGLTEAGRLQGAFLIGGDLSRSRDGILISIAALGESLKRKVLYRYGGRPDHLLYVTGVLGRSAAGLRLLQDNCLHPRSRPRQEAIQAHRKPEARCSTGVWLAQSGLVSCMMDLSDGLSADLPRMCAASGVGAEINISSLPVFRKSCLWDCDPVALALHGGEDFELLFAVPRSKALLLERAYPARFPRITNIGQMIPEIGRIWITESGKNRRRLLDKGYDHFR